VASLFLPGCSTVEADVEVLEWVRRGKIHVHAEPGAELTLEIEPTQGPDDYAYLLGPDGRTLERRLLDRRRGQTLTLPLGSRGGTYTIIPSPSHRLRVSARKASFTFEPEHEFPSLHVDGTHRYVFDVPEGTTSFTLAVTNQHDWEGAPATVSLHRPDGWLEHRFELEALDRETVLRRLGISAEQQRLYEQQGDTAVVPEFRLLIERHTVTDPVPGRWEVEAAVRTLRPDDIGFWLEGLPSLFAPSGGTPIAPPVTPVTASLRVDASRIVGPTGDVGTVWGWTVYDEEALEAYRTMGLSASKNFYPQVDMEGHVVDGTWVAGNDDRDPRHIQWDGFLFDRFRSRLDVYDEQRVPMTMLAVISRIAPWARESLPEIAEFAEACVRYHQVRSPVDPSRLYWQFLNEPNHEVSLHDYVAAFTAVGERVSERLESDDVPVRFGGPATGNAWSDPEDVPWEWIEALITHADASLDFVVWNQYRLGRIEDTWRYAAHIARVDSLIDALDTDGQREEILIGATNLRGGIVLQTERQDGPYSAIWWPSVICQTMGTGRCRLLNYFWLIDHGSRRKGLLRSDWSMKPVAHATAFASDYRGPQVVASSSDHDGVHALATRDDRGELRLLVVNTLERPVMLDVTVAPDETWRTSVETLDATTLERLEAVTDGELPIRFEMAPWSLAGLRAERSDAP
jgi:hypothetical protein